MESAARADLAERNRVTALRNSNPYEYYSSWRHSMSHSYLWYFFSDSQCLWAVIVIPLRAGWFDCWSCLNCLTFVASSELLHEISLFWFSQFLLRRCICSRYRCHCRCFLLKLSRLDRPCRRTRFDLDARLCCFRQLQRCDYIIDTYFCSVRVELKWLMLFLYCWILVDLKPSIQATNHVIRGGPNLTENQNETNLDQTAGRSDGNCLEAVSKWVISNDDVIEIWMSHYLDTWRVDRNIFINCQCIIEGSIWK